MQNTYSMKKIILFGFVVGLLQYQLNAQTSTWNDAKITMEMNNKINSTIASDTADLNNTVGETSNAHSLANNQALSVDSMERNNTPSFKPHKNTFIPPRKKGESVNENDK